MTNEIITFEQATKLTGRKAIDFFSNEEKVRPLIDSAKKKLTEVVHDVTTKKGRDAIGSDALKASKSRKALEGAITKSVADLDSQVKKAKAVKKIVIEEFNEIRDEILQPRIDWQKEQDRLEEERIAAIQERINNIKILGVISGCATKENLGEKIDAINEMQIGEDFEEFIADALKTKDYVLGVLNDEVNKIVKREIEEANQRELAIEKKKIEITGRIQKLQGVPIAMFAVSSSEVHRKLEALRNNPPTEADFDDSYTEAMSAYHAVIGQLEMLYDQKVQMEAVQAKEIAPAPEPEVVEPEVVEPEVETTPNPVQELSGGLTKKLFSLSDDDQDAPMFTDCVADQPAEQVEDSKVITIDDTLTYFLDLFSGDVEMAELVVTQIELGNVPGVMSTWEN
jgi:hypothetical protein